MKEVLDNLNKVLWAIGYVATAEGTEIWLRPTKRKILSLKCLYRNIQHFAESKQIVCRLEEDAVVIVSAKRGD